MESSSLELYGQALLDYFDGRTEANITIRREDGFAASLPVAYFFRTGAGFSPIDVIALENCRGDVLDIGAGAGCHSLALQEQGLNVTAIDSIPQAVEVMRRRGVKDARCEDIYQFAGGPFDTALMLGHGIGMTGDLDGLERFLEKMHTLIKPGGELLADSLDVSASREPVHVAYRQANIRANRFRGEIRMRNEYKGQIGALMKWLHVDYETLEEIATARGWECRELHWEPIGDFLACLTH